MRVNQPVVEPDIVVVGGTRAPFRDVYHAFLRLTFVEALALILGGIIGINVLFALAYLATGGIANAAPGSFVDAFSFSMQTIVTIGYGQMYPASGAAKLVSDVEAMSGLMITALSTGLLFTKFSQTRATLTFAKRAVVCIQDGIPTLIMRIGNERANLIVEAQARVVLTRTERTAEGRLFYRMYDLKLVRDRSISFTGIWQVMHRITLESPLYGATSADLAAQEAEIACAVVGIDDTSLQPIHGKKVWSDADILFGHRLADMLDPQPDGKLWVHINRFDDVEPDPTPAPPPHRKKTRLHHVQLAAPAGEPGSAEAAARRFFGEVLAYAELPKPAGLAENGGAWFQTDDVQIHIGLDPEFHPAKKAHPAFELPDIHELRALYSRVEAADAHPRWDTRQEGVTRFFADDPWGNRLEFFVVGTEPPQKAG